ncbi:MAG: DNA repair protein RecN [Calditrichia bacterium]
MLKRIHIRQFALAENLTVEFQSGLNILTGETGAGKSILVGAIGAVLGGRVYTEVIRTGFDKASVEAVFDISSLTKLKTLLDERGLPGGNELIVRREIANKGNARAFINDATVTVATLADIGNFLVDIHGQHQHQSLLRRETHRYFIDAFGRLNNELEAVNSAWQALRKLDAELNTLLRRQKELSTKRELYEFQSREIAQADPSDGEDKKLEEEARVLANIEKLFALSSELGTIFSGGDLNLLGLNADAEQRLKEIGNISSEIKKLSDEFTSARIVVDETARSIEEFKNNLEFDGERLEEVEARLSVFASLKKKYGGTLEAVIAYQKEITASLSLQDNVDFEIETFNKRRNKLLQDYAKVAIVLTKKRQKAATRMEKAVQDHLKHLGMPNIRFQVRFDKREEANGVFLGEGASYFGDENGVDQIEFFISPNPGEDFKPLSKIASGGEMSRIMLALKNILAEIDEIPTLIFDEVDSGVSGRIAQAVGRSISQLAESHQILCITHLAQIASQGDSHYAVEKYVDGDRTFTQITALSESQRIEAIARLMGGEHISDTVLESARQLIEESRSS